jgi:hypothetical protein
MKLTKRQILNHVCCKDDNRKPLQCIHILKDGIYSSDGKRLMIVGLTPQQAEAYKTELSVPCETFAKFARMMPKPKKHSTEVPTMEILPDETEPLSSSHKNLTLSCDDGNLYKESTTMKTVNYHTVNTPPNFKAVIPDNSKEKVVQVAFNIDLLVDTLKQMKEASGKGSVIFKIVDKDKPVILNAFGNEMVWRKSSVPSSEHEVMAVLMPVRLRE